MSVKFEPVFLVSLLPQHENHEEKVCKADENSHDVTNQDGVIDLFLLIVATIFRLAFY